ncbi:major head protein [Caulobacter phage CcrPW]|uniref:Major capsid protein n=1 Tax=Caulobacter phage CcrPW TaxID=2283271 RepID=A0A385E9Z1_9CAUD|nr:major head protein [Caulobacter phage CcrPW]AXQ68623.1 major capsid protein [Caulobacter phage CcrPW]
MAALTLLEASDLAMGNDEVKRSAIIELFAYPDLLKVLPFMDVPGGSYTYTQEGALPGVAFRGFNEAYTNGVGVVNSQVEVLKIVGGDLDVDKALIKTHGADIRTRQEKMKVKALSLFLAGKIINGDSEQDPREFDGLRKRIVGSQRIPAGGTNGGDPLSLQILDEAIDAVEGATHLVMSKRMRNLLSAASRQTSVAGFITWDKTEFGERIAYYNDLPILVTDYDDKNVQVIDFNEACPGGGTTGTSIYVLNIGDSGVIGLQNGVMEVDDLGQVNDKPVYRTRIEWLISLAVMSGRAAARVWGIKKAPVVA